MKRCYSVGRQTHLFLLSSLLFLCTISLGNADDAKNVNKSSTSIANKVEITFQFNRLFGIASNQYALWIETTKGEYVKTLYATRFTATGGWKSRPESLPTWVRSSSITTKPPTRVDTLTGATPGSGNKTYHWDYTDEYGKIVADGDYKVFIEGSIRWQHRILYTATVGKGTQTREITVEKQTEGGTDEEKRMITNVKINYQQ